MPEHDTDFERHLAQRLRAYESRIPDAEAPVPDTHAARRAPWHVLIGGGAVAIVAGGLLALVLINAPRDEIGDATPPPTRSAEATSIETPSPSIAPAPSAVPSPSAEPTATPIPTVAPRSGWSTRPVIEQGDYTAVGGVAEVRGQLFALGRAGRTQPAIWISEDGETWTATDVPPITDRMPGYEGSFGDLTGTVVGLIDAGDRLVAIATLGLAEGSGLFGTMIYASDDGLTWTEVRETPGITAAPMFALVRVGDRLVAAGGGFWSSDDGGLSWTELVSRASVGGTIYALDSQGDIVVAVGDGGNGDLTGPPALAMVSTDRGDTWERIVIDPAAGATSVAIGEAGRIVVGGHLNNRLVIWVSDDLGESWRSTSFDVVCCGGDLVATPTGYVMANNNSSFQGALMSPDGLTWTEHPIEGGLAGVGWGPRFGFSAANGTAIMLGPVPAP